MDHEIVTNITGTADKDVATAVGQALSGDKTITYDGSHAPVLSVISTNSDGNEGESSLITFYGYDCSVLLNQNISHNKNSCSGELDI